MTGWHLRDSVWLPASPASVFGFFADAQNLEAMTPPWLHFRILTPLPIDMHAGTLIDYQIRLHGIRLQWRTEISAWDPPHRFVDEQRRGPYSRWRHEHTFLAQDGGTLAADHVEYDVPGGSLVQRLLVTPDLKRIFAFRKQRLAENFPGAAI